MDTDIHFGDLEESTPDTQLRPDRNKQFAVAAIDSPIERDLPVFVDLDVMIDMEEHALEDINVELGGVMLGGQFHDEDGKPFVLITDSLRAKHYESTKGSFKFTHDTWSEITREREEFPDDLQMVGWYHTHPDWGVFLSGMDMFICDNFFNKFLDMALVIDPCRDDRGMFQWTGDPAKRIRRTGGFYLISSRFRADELELVAEQLSGDGDDMAVTRTRTIGGGNSPTVVQVPDRQSWQGTAVIGMLTMQFLLVLLVAVKVLFPSWGIGDERLENLENRVATLTVAERNHVRNEAQDDLLDKMFESLGQGKEAFTKSLDTKEEAAQWKASALGQGYRVEEMSKMLSSERKELREANQAYENVKKTSLAVRKQRDKYRDEVKDLRKQLGIDEEDDAETDVVWGVSWFWWPIWGTLLLALIMGAVFASMGNQKETHYGDPDDEDDAPAVEFEDPEAGDKNSSDDAEQGS